MPDLPLLNPDQDLKSSLRSDGSRTYPQPADVRGRFTRWRHIVFWVLIAIWIVLPWIPVGGRPAVFLDIEHRQFFLFGFTFNAQDAWLVFFLVTGAAFALIYVTALVGRVWCGWACPQTVWLEAVYRRIERIVEGPRETRIRRNAGSWNWDKVWRKGLAHTGYVLVSFLIGHIFVAYFVSLPKLWGMMRTSPSEHPEAFLWAFGVTGLVYFNYAWFREQLCLVICPYGRLQSVLTDDQSLGVGYDEKRGEPRGKVKATDRGACVDCNRCVTVCPMGIDVRKGMQLDCIACMSCVDACDEIMVKVNQPTGLVRYDALQAFNGNPVRFWRPRMYLYTGILFVGLAIALFAVSRRTEFDATLLRMPGAPYVTEGDQVRNSFEVHIVNKASVDATYVVSAEVPDGVTAIVPVKDLVLKPFESRRLPVMLSMPRGGAAAGREVSVRVKRTDSSGEKLVRGPLLGGT